MITRTKIRTKIAALLDDNEYKRQYFDEGGVITGATSARDDIDPEAITSFKTGYFNDETHAVAQSATIIVVNTADGKYYNELPTEADLAVATSDQQDTPFVVADMASTTVIYDSAVQGPPTGDGVEILSYSLPSSGDFFDDLNTYALIAAASYELATEQAALDLADLKAQLVALGAQVT